MILDKRTRVREELSVYLWLYSAQRAFDARRLPVQLPDGWQVQQISLSSNMAMACSVHLLVYA